VKLKAIHLLRRLERIDRDLEELQQLQNSIQEDRAYARTLKESLSEEFSRLRQFKSRILTQIITNPPPELSGEESAPLRTPVSTPGTHEIRRPEISIPILKKEPEAVRSEPKSIPEAVSSVAAKEPAPKKPAFRFVYDNKSNH
jgi:hypothetical protein